MTTDPSIESRLEALGTELDAAAHRAADLRVRHARGTRRPAARDMLTIAAALLLLVGLGALVARFVGDSGNDPETAADLPATQAPGSSTTTTTEALLDPWVVEALDAPAPADSATCARNPITNWPSPIAPPPGQTETFRVGHGPNCESGYVRASERAPRLYPVYRTPTGSEQIGWWANDVGWVTPHAAGVARFDVAKLAVARAYIDAPPPGYGPDGERLEPADEPSGD